MVIDRREFKRSALWSAALTVPAFLLGLFMFDVHGEHAFEFTAPLGGFELPHARQLQVKRGMRANVKMTGPPTHAAKPPPAVVGPCRLTS